ncbi:MAG TPA: P-II family nitrogen regulator [Nitrososphaera sp.]|jgi:nitrogen regulatory protein PII
MGKEKSNLPFEVTYTEKAGTKSRTPMKRLAVLLKPEKVDAITTALRGLGLEATLYDVKGAGKEKERVTSGRGMGTIDLAYTTRKIVATVVNADSVSQVTNVMKNALGGDSGAVVVVTPVDELVRL